MNVKKKTRLGLLALCMLTMLLFCGFQAQSVSAATTNPTQVLKDGKYYWKENGKYRFTVGWYNVGVNRYYITKGGSCATGFYKVGTKLYYFTATGKLSKTVGWHKGPSNTYYFFKDYSLAYGFNKIDGKLYYFSAYGRLPKNVGWHAGPANTYYFNADHSLATGLKKISGKIYYFKESNGRLQKNQTAVKFNGNYYNLGKDGALVRISNTKGDCIIEARKFIDRHSSASSSNAARFRSCFNYLVAYLDFKPYLWSVSENYRRIDSSDSPYNLALETFRSPTYVGDCHRFAACIAVIAKELGYQPYYIASTGDHSFVMINGGYYDNMGPLFGSSSHFAYDTYRKIKL